MLSHVTRALTALARAHVRAGEATVTKAWREQHPPTPAADYDLALVDHYAPAVQAALGRLFTRAELRSAIITARQGAPLRKAANPDPAAQFIASIARGHLNHLGARDQVLLDVLQRLYADSWIAGMHVATVQTGATGPGEVGALAAGMDWSRWAPGDVEAALKAADGGLRAMLDRAGITLRGLTDTTVRQLGDAIAAGLLAGHSVDRIAGDLTGLLGGNDYRALVIAHTETARALTAATVDSYAANGIRRFDWLTTSGACPLCLDYEAKNPHDLTDAKPPGHPLCRCAVAPALNPDNPAGALPGVAFIDLNP